MYLSQRKFAKLVNRSHTYINKLVKQGVIPTYQGKIKKDEAIKILEEHKDPSRDAQREANEKRRNTDLFSMEVKYGTIADLSEEERKEYEKKLREEQERAEKVLEEAKKEGIEIGGELSDLLGTMNLNEAKTISEILTAKLKEIQYKKEKSELILKEEVEREAFEVGRRVRDAVLSVPDRVSAILSAETDRNKIKEILNNELRHSLEILGETHGNL